MDSPPRTRFSTALLWASAFGLVGVGLLGLWQLSYVILLGFLGILMAMLLRQPAEMIARRTPLGVHAALALVCLIIAGLVLAFLGSVGPRVFSQLGQLGQQLPDAIERVTEMLQQHEWGRFLIERLVPAEVAAGGGAPAASGGGGGAGPAGSILNALTVTLTATIGSLANIVVVVTLAVFLGLNPRYYRRGALMLVPRPYRGEADRISGQLGDSLWKWLLGQMADMAIVALAIGTGLWLIGVPLSLALGIVAGLLNFVPYVGAFAGAVPALLMAFGVGMDAALWTIGLFVVVQQLEGNVIMPMIQRRATHLPPALTILAVTGFGVLFGILGLLLATPLLLVIIVLVNELWVKRINGGEVPDVEAEAERHEKRVSAGLTAR